MFEDIRKNAVPRYSPQALAFIRLVLEVFRLNGTVLEAGDALTRPLGLTAARWQVLGALDDEPRTVPEVARIRGLARQSVQRTADRLATDGLLVFLDNPEHKRSRLMAQTQAGREAMAAVFERESALVNALTVDLDAGMLNAASALLAELDTRLRSGGAEEPGVTANALAGKDARKGDPIPPRATKRRR